MKKFYKCEICNTMYDSDQAIFTDNGTCEHFGNRYIPSNNFLTPANAEKGNE